MLMTQSVALFLIAGLFEIGGGYLVWQWWRNGSHWSIGLLGRNRWNERERRRGGPASFRLAARRRSDIP